MDREQYNINRSYEIAVRNLNSRAWGEVMLPSEKIGDLQAIENKNAMDQGRIACSVRAEPMEPGLWGYQQGTEIVINANELNNPDFIEHIDTIYHEGSHARDWQAQFFSGIRSEYTQEQLQAIHSPIPDSKIDPNGYWNHPAEVKAREAGTQGVEKTLSDQEQIAQVDMANHTPINQILQTYDYLALESTPSQEVATSVSLDTDRGEEATSAANLSAEVGQGEEATSAANLSAEVGQGEDMSDSIDLSNGEEQGAGYEY